MKPIVKLMAWPIIFIAWCIYRLTHICYVDSPDFIEYWEKL